MRNRFLLALVSLGLAFQYNGCGGTQSEYVPPAVILPPHIKSIAVKPFENETSQTVIGNKPSEFIFWHHGVSLKLNREPREKLVRHLSFDPSK